MYKYVIKRLIDFIFALIAFVVFFPFFLVVWILLMISNKSMKVFFVQPRIGKNDKVFMIVKFKTMTDEKDDKGNLLPDVQRLTKIGKFVRSTSLDEIPQLLNVLKGDMSLIGPRPLLVQYLPLYNATQRRRHEVRPGITGWAQVNGRNTISWKAKFEYDVWYVDNISMGLDIKIIIKTVLNVLTRSGVEPVDKVTMEYFNGYE